MGSVYFDPKIETAINQEVGMKKFLIGVVSLLAAQAAFAGCPGYTEEELLTENAGDDRLIRSAASPRWLEAVGKFVFVKTPQWQLDRGDPEAYENCSVSLVSDTLGGDGQIVVGAGHCIVQWVSGTTSKPSAYIDELRATESGRHWERDTVYDWEYEQENMSSSSLPTAEKWLNDGSPKSFLPKPIRAITSLADSIVRFRIQRSSLCSTRQRITAIYWMMRNSRARSPRWPGSAGTRGGDDTEKS